MSESRKEQCESNNFKRVRYFHGMLLGDRDFKEEQSYHSEKRRLLNRALHGWGVVCGLGIDWEKGSNSITLQRGVALDCHGNEIVVCEPLKIDLKDAFCPVQTGNTTPKTAEDCRKAEEQKDAEANTFYLGIRYREVPVAPVPAYVPGGGCEEKQCDNSRIQEGFCIDVFANIPPQPRPLGFKVASQQVAKDTEANGADVYSIEGLAATLDGYAMEKFCDSSIPCPDSVCCPSDHYLVLADITVKNGTSSIESVCINKHRTYVLSAPMAKYLIYSILAGKCFGENQPPIEDWLHSNPIALLCWGRHTADKGVPGQANRSVVSNKTQGNAQVEGSKGPHAKKE